MSIIGFVLSIITLLVFTSCASEYQIEGNSSVSRLDGKMLFLKISSGTKMINIDSAEVVHGLFQMQGEMDSVVLASLYMDDQSIMPLVIEPGNIQIQIDNVNITVAGTPLNDKLYGFIGKKNALDDRAYEIERNESCMIMEGKSMSEVEVMIEAERGRLSKEMDELVKTFIQSNYHNVLGPSIFVMLCSGFPYPIITPLIEELVNEAPESFKSHDRVKEYMTIARENMEKLNATR